MSKKNQKKNKTEKKEESLKSAEKSNNNKDIDIKNESIDVHYPPEKSSGNFDKNIIIVIICFIIIFSIVIIEKNCYTKNIKETENINQTPNIEITSEPLIQVPAETEKIIEEPKIIEKKQSETPKKQINKTNIEVTDKDEEGPMFTIEPLKEELPYEEKIDAIDISQELSAIVLDFDSDYQLTKNHKSYLIEKLDTAKKLGHSNNVVIYGYVSDKKIEEDNINQSLKMANLVAEYLTKNGYIPVSVQGKGSEDLEDNHIRRKVEVQLLQYR
ncbi:hypothetical protein MASR1M68_05400 [Elusimicrobiota bacterium]